MGSGWFARRALDSWRGLGQVRRTPGERGAVAWRRAAVIAVRVGVGEQ